MKKRTLIAVLGVWVALVPPFLLLPPVWKNWIISASGLLIAFLAAVRKRVYIEMPRVSKGQADQTAEESSSSARSSVKK